jgi:hypothetical protein
MAGDIANIDHVLLGVFGIRRVDLKDKPLLLLSEHIARGWGHCQAQQCHSRQRKCGFSFHGPFLLVVTR